MLQATSVDLFEGYGVNTTEVAVFVEGIDQVIGVIAIFRFAGEDAVSVVTAATGA